MTAGTPSSGRRLARALAGLAVLVGLAGCRKDEYTLVYSHNLHVKENGIACQDCHGAPVNGRFALPGHAACQDCHGDAMDPKTAGPKTCGICHKVRDLKALAARPPAAPAGPAGGVFVHTAALSNRCTDCHGQLMDKQLKSVPELTHSAKVQIRERAHAWGWDCRTCHVGLDRQTPPPSHSKNWTRNHGLAGSQSDNACGVCHRAESCRECHQTMKPDSHNNLWRLKTHGIRAAWDRARCLVCHRQDACIACHSETRPQSHNAAWRQNHCLNCHPSAATGTGCNLCHPASLQTHPNPHPAGWRNQHCLTCHPGTPDTKQCSVCHGGDPVGSHPNPHPAGWVTTHCNTCHAGAPDSRQCEVCHGHNLLGNHPSPHPAGWLDQHCNTCHPGGPDIQQCQLCHGRDLVGGHPDPHAAGWRKKHCLACHPGGNASDCAVCHPGGSSVLVHQSFWPPVHNRFGDQADCYVCHKP